VIGTCGKYEVSVFKTSQPILILKPTASCRLDRFNDGDFCGDGLRKMMFEVRVLSKCP
jgi:hypothetical protein